MQEIAFVFEGYSKMLGAGLETLYTYELVHQIYLHSHLPMVSA